MEQDAGRSSKQAPHRVSGSDKTKDEDGPTQPHPSASTARDDEATLAYIKRVLCLESRETTGTKHFHDLLPPLTSSNAVDVQVYAFIAVVLSFAVQSWYQRITPDHQFVGEIVQIIAHCTRGLEGRLREVDLESLVLDEIPDLVTEHAKAVNVSRTSRLKSLTVDEKRLRYHALRPHLALYPAPTTIDSSTVQQENEVAWCLLLVNRILPLLLPPEDLQNPCLDVMVSEILSELIFHNGLCGKACEPWLLWEGITKVLRPFSRQESQELSRLGPASPNSPKGLDMPASTRTGASEKAQLRWRFDAVSRSFWITLQSIITIWLLLRSLFFAVLQASSIPSRTDRSMRGLGTASEMRASSPPLWRTSHSHVGKRAMLSMRACVCVSQLLSLDRRMPWLTGTLSLLQRVTLKGPGQLGCSNSRLDRLISFTVQEKLLCASWLPSVLRAARLAVFPGHALSPVRSPPTSDEVAHIRLECADAIVEAIPEVARARFFATKDRDLMREDVASELDILADPYINKHLIVGLVELVVVRLFPELRAGDDTEGILHS